MDEFTHKGYVGVARVEVEDKVIAGHVIGLRAVITFEGDTVAEAEQAFRDSVDDYLDWCRERGVAPEPPFSGDIRLRISAELHRSLAFAAEKEGTTVEAMIVTMIGPRDGTDRDARRAKPASQTRVPGEARGRGRRGAVG